MKILFYGFRHGHIFSLYEKCVNDPETQIRGCVEDNEQARIEAQNRCEIKFDQKSYEEMLESDCDCVAIGLCYGERGQAIIKALKAGKNVISDKPLCTNISELNEIRSLCAQKGLKCCLMLDLRWSPAANAAKKIYQSGMLGDVKNIAFEGQHPLNYGKRPMWYFEKGKHGGTINDLAIHGVDLVNMITGLDYMQTDFARVWNAFAKNEPGFNDSAVFSYRLSNGASVSGDTSYSSPTGFKGNIPNYWSFRLWCEKGLMSFNCTDSDVSLYIENTEGCQKVNGENIDGDYFSAFKDECRSDSSYFTESSLISTETALKIQEFADEK